jgi:E3 ubiquitin-protein ligase listerin
MHLGQLESIAPVLGSAILRSAWVELDPTVQEIMWQPLLVFLKRMYRLYFDHDLKFSYYKSPEFPQSWTLDDIKDEGDGGSESEVEIDDDEPQHAAKTVTPSSLPQKQAYLEFLQFLQLGCSGSPLQGYPTVMIILSTIPSSVRCL